MPGALSDVIRVQRGGHGEQPLEVLGTGRRRKDGEVDSPLRRGEPIAVRVAHAARGTIKIPDRCRTDVLRDLAGLDTYLTVAEPLLRELESSAEVLSILRQKVERGELGVKSGQGFYTWTPESAAALRERIGRALVELGRLE